MNPEQIRNMVELQIEVKHLREDLADMVKKMQKTDERLDLLYALLNRGRGVTWFLVLVFSIFGVGGVVAVLQALQPFLKGH